MVNVPKIDNRKIKAGKARELTSSKCIEAFEEKKEKKWLTKQDKTRKTERKLKKKPKERGVEP